MSDKERPPVPVVLAGVSDPELSDKIKAPITPANIASQTTSEQDRHSFGQRRINLIWEVTQAIIAIIVTMATLYVAANLALRGDGQTAAFLLLSNAFFLVIGFYFSRSNHNRINDTARTPGDDRIDTR